MCTYAIYEMYIQTYMDILFVHSFVQIATRHSLIWFCVYKYYRHMCGEIELCLRFDLVSV